MQDLYIPSGRKLSHCISLDETAALTKPKSATHTHIISVDSIALLLQIPRISEKFLKDIRNVPRQRFLIGKWTAFMTAGQQCIDAREAIHYTDVSELSLNTNLLALSSKTSSVMLKCGSLRTCTRRRTSPWRSWKTVDPSASRLTSRSETRAHVSELI